MRAYTYTPEITFESTNVVGNVYFANFVRWQGACRERFLRDHAPGVLRMIANREIAFHTSRVVCDYSDPIGASLDDHIVVEMMLKQLRGGRLTVAFDYYRVPADGGERERIAVGEQAIACKRISGGRLTPCVFPVEMLEALQEYASSEDLFLNIKEAIDFSRNSAQASPSFVSKASSS